MTTILMVRVTMVNAVMVIRDTGALLYDSNSRAFPEVFQNGASLTGVALWPGQHCVAVATALPPHHCTD